MTSCASLPRHAPSLTTLLLQGISLEDTTSGPIPFPSLTYLSLYDVTGLKPHMDAPCLATYHEGGSTMDESFPASSRSIVEYGVVRPRFSAPDLTKWDRDFPNVSRLAVRTDLDCRVGVLECLASHPHLLPALRMISLRNPYGLRIEGSEEPILQIVESRREAYRMDIAVHFEAGNTFQIPITLAIVSHWPIR